MATVHLARRAETSSWLASLDGETWTDSDSPPLDEIDLALIRYRLSEHTDDNGVVHGYVQYARRYLDLAGFEELAPIEIEEEEA